MSDAPPAVPEPAPRKPSAARERLLTTAGRLFYAEGVHTVGVDRVISEAQITRATFYRHLGTRQPGQPVSLRIFRGNQAHTVTLAAGDVVAFFA